MSQQRVVTIQTEQPEYLSPASESSLWLGEGLVTAREVAKHVGCHEETVRRADHAGRLRSVRFGARGKRFHPRDVREWIARGMRTK